MFRKWTLNPLSISRIKYELLSFSRNHYLFIENTLNSLNISRIYYESTTFFANTLSVSRIYFGLTIFCANSQWIYYLSRKFITNSLSSRINLVFRDSLLINNLLREFTTIFCLYRKFSTNLCLVSRIHYEMSIFRIQN